MLRTKVESSSIASIGYEEKSRILEIEFIEKSIYQYFDVPIQVANEFRYSPFKGSFGKHFNIYIMNNYDFKRIT